jgi:hypothetical protein
MSLKEDVMEEKNAVPDRALIERLTQWMLVAEREHQFELDGKTSLFHVFGNLLVADLKLAIAKLEGGRE